MLPQHIRTSGLAESRRAKLMTAAREGESFDERTGLPASELRRHYAKSLDGVREQANRDIERSMREWDRVSRARRPRRDRGLGPGRDQKHWSGAGTPVEGTGRCDVNRALL
ncbi:hypothetical protein [Streptomyces sp. NPDC001970]